MFQVQNKNLLKALFAAKGNFARGDSPGEKVVDGYEILPFFNGTLAAVCVSADLELSWAWRSLPDKARDARGKSDRENVSHILTMLEEYQVPVTWATVGHLFLEQCERGICGRAHAALPRPLRNDRWSGDWYRHDPCTNLDRDPLWYAPDLVKRILESKVRHEIGSHSFSHVDFSLETSNSELIRAELETCIEVMEKFGISLKSLVYPYNKMGHHYSDLLADYKINAVRHRDQRIRLSYPKRDMNGVYHLTESMNLRVQKYYNYAEKAKIFIDEAKKRHAVYHIWFHPSDPLEVFETVFSNILAHVSQEVQRNTVWAATMSEISAYCEAREKTFLSVSHTESEATIGFKRSFNLARYGSPTLTVAFPKGVRPVACLLEKDDGVTEAPTHTVSRGNGTTRTLINVPGTVKAVRAKFCKS
jgi:peptidoglycan/xylan/chitin deacetylase (PgdA/CDA1 family)